MSLSASSKASGNPDQAAFTFDLFSSPDIADALPSSRCARAPIGSATTTPR